jgi:hypothetical protein
VAVTWAGETIFGPLTYYARAAQPPLLRALHPDSWGQGASQLAHLALHRFVGPSCHIYPSALGVLKTKSLDSFACPMDLPTLGGFDLVGLDGGWGLRVDTFPLPSVRNFAAAIVGPLKVSRISRRDLRAVSSAS